MRPTGVRVRQHPALSRGPLSPARAVMLGLSCRVPAPAGTAAVPQRIAEYSIHELEPWLSSCRAVEAPSSRLSRYDTRPPAPRMMRLGALEATHLCPRAAGVTRANAGVLSTLFSTQFNTSTGRLAHDTNRASRDAHTRTGAGVTRSLVTELRSGSERSPPRFDAIATTQLPRAPRSDGVFARVSACAP
jgi:hypothetical protein